ncbi:MAG TPA: hypothetical protein VIL74_22325 [Pyrinomonadaceae bacterium]|jgi:hypothetical protein
MKLIFRGKEYQSFSECYKDNLDIAKVSIPTFIKRIREGKSIDEALTAPKGRTLVSHLGSHTVDGVEYENLPSIARAYGLKESLVYRRYHRGLRGNDLIPAKLRKNYVPRTTPKKESPWKIEVNGVTYRSLRQACRVLGVDIGTYTNRRAKGYSIEQSLGLVPIVRPPRRSGKIYEIDGEKYTLTEIGKEFSINLMTFLRRLDRGMSAKEAATREVQKIERDGK